MEKTCKTCKIKFIPIGFIPPRRAWNNSNSKKTRFQKKHKINNGRIPWNKDKDFGGTEYLAKRISWLTLYRKWKKLVKKRDDYKCIQCEGSKQLNIDHYPISLAKLIRKYNIKNPQEAKQYKEFWDINNGRTLCIDCHKKTLTYGRNFVQKM